MCSPCATVIRDRPI